MKVHPDVLDALSRATTDGTQLLLGGPKMTAALYQRVNEVIEGAGGRWDRAAGVHLFPGDAAAAIAPVLATGQVTTLREVRAAGQYFPTPAPVVARLVELARLAPGMDVLEPSAGRGAIAVAVAGRGCHVDCIEQDPGHAAVLQETGAARAVTVADFLAVPADPRFDRVIMNPPFTLQADIAHVTHALGFLRPGGLLVAVMARTVAYQPSARTFRDLVEQRGGTVEALLDGAFTASGTSVRTVCVTIPATWPANAEPVAWPSEFTPATPEMEPAHREPWVIAAEIAAYLATAQKLFADLARHLAPQSAVQGPLRPIVTTRQERPGQLTFDGPEEVSGALSIMPPAGTQPEPAPAVRPIR